MLTNPDEIVRVADQLLELRAAEADTLDVLHAYWRGTQPLPIVPRDVPAEVKRMVEMSRVNLCALAVEVPAQSLFVDGYREPSKSENDALWTVWNANRMNMRQSGVYRAAFAYGAAYTVVLPGSPYPVISPKSPRKLTTAYTAADPDWPEYALEVVDSLDGPRYLLYDDEAVHTLADQPTGDPDQPTRRVWLSTEYHNLGVCPVVRFRNVDDIEDEPCSEIAPLIPLQDQMDFTTFDLLVAQHYQAFRQRYVMGWVDPSEADKAKAAASILWTFDDPDTKVGEFGQVDLTGYLKSREATIQHFGVLSQIPPNHLIGQMVNLSAEALVAAEVGQRRKILERRTGFGEAQEQQFELTARAMGREPSPNAEIRWRDTEARSLAQTVDALSKMKDLGVPVEALWERIPDVTQLELERWRALFTSADSISLLNELLDRQMGALDPATV